MIESLVDFPGTVVGINPRGGKGLYTSVADAVAEHGPIDLAISCIPAGATAPALREAAEAGVGAALICSGGFSEAGGPGDGFEADLMQVVEDTGLRILGPNTSGFFLPGENLLACFVPGVKLLADGNISVVSSSGGVNLATCFNLHRSGRGIRLGLGIGGAINLTATEIVEYLTEDDKTKVIALHIEKVEDGPRLVEAIRQASKRKPVVALVIGRTDIKEFARSHTGSLDTSWQLTRSILEQSGAVVVDTEQELAEAVIALSARRIEPKANPQVAFVTGPGWPRHDYRRPTPDGRDLPATPGSGAIRENHKHASAYDLHEKPGGYRATSARSPTCDRSRRGGREYRCYRCFRYRRGDP